MRKSVSGVVAVGLIGVLTFFYLTYPPLTLLDPGGYEQTTVTITDDNGTELGTVDVRVAETTEQRRVGLSRASSLANGSGMLFVHDSSDTQRYHMRNVSFGLDMVFIDSDGTITEIVAAPPPERGGTGPYRATGQYVLEVPRGWMASIGAQPGDTVGIPDSIQPKA